MPKMKKKPIFNMLLLIVMMLLGSACSKSIYFTQVMKYQVEDHGIDLRDVQFYNSRKFILQRNLTIEETKVAQGKIRFENGQFIEQIIIKKNTPGVCEEIEPNALMISFETGENRNLKFVLNTKDNYQISALDWTKKYGRVAYDTTYYYIIPGGEKTLLKVKKDDIYKIDRQERIAPGRKVIPSS